MSAPSIFTRPARLAAIAPYLWMALFFFVPFGFVLKIGLSQTAIAQPPYTPVFDLTDGFEAIKTAFAALSLDNFRLLVSDDLYVLSYVRSLVVAVVSTAILLILTTRWADILKSLTVLKMPSVFVLVLAMAYRYIFLFLHTANGMFLARKSRIVARTSGKEQRWWIVSTIGVLMSRSFRMSEEVYQAMLARGFTDRIVSMDEYHFGLVDGVTLIGTVGAAALAVYAGWYLI